MPEIDFKIDPVFPNLGVRCRVSGVSKQMTDDRKQESDRVLQLPVLPFVFCRLTSVL